MSFIKENLKEINIKINDFKRLNNISYDIQLIAVSKQKPVEAIQNAIEWGQYVFGENRLQEAEIKIPLINNPRVQWHFIGHLQSNKIKKAVELFHVIHSVDKISTASEINKHCSNIGKIMPIFIQVNTTQEEQKSGIDPSTCEELIRKILTLKHIQIIGLMTISLFTEDNDLIRKSFQSLRQLKDRMNKEFNNLNMKYLSMGMSGDYEIALEEGATHLRLGTSIFGSRK